MAKPNFSFQKRQREQERARKKQEKMDRKRERAAAAPDEQPLDEAPSNADGDDAPPSTPAP
ncbi:MAG: hypothetical protein HYR75_07925 [Gemmatimonadetes bacterium]|nr:hypothetical protein [Gemmatimonadota bacterium]MBI3567805.1 hypothetical protein [Gemmatimonadota bacterium]